MSKKQRPLWAVMLERFADNEWRIRIDELMGKRGWRSHSQIFSQLRKIGVKIICDEVPADEEMISRWTIPEESRPFAITLLKSELAGKKIPYANLEPPPTRETLFDIGTLKANALQRDQYRVER